MAGSLNTAAKYGSDLIVDILRQYNVEYIACNPGATIRGLHDSVVNYADNKNPELILCCHEEIAVAVAHGYAKASGKFMAVLLHSNVGLLHASMALFNAWCDRVPMLVIGGVGPLDSSKRRPWIDWIHTSNNQAGSVRDYVKWEDQPYNLASVPESLYRACKLTDTVPKAPVYIAVDALIQESEIEEELEAQDVSKYLPPSPSLPNCQTLHEIAEKMLNAESPVIVADYLGRNLNAVQRLIDFAELLSIPLIDCGGRYNFPSNYSLNLTGVNDDIFTKADVILAIDVNDLHGILGKRSQLNKNAKLINISLSDYLVSKWSADYQKLYPVDISIAADGAMTLSALCELCKRKITSEQRKKYMVRFATIQKWHNALREKWKNIAQDCKQQDKLTVASVLYEIWQVVKSEDFMVVNYGSVEMGKWMQRLWEFDKDNIHLGFSGGAGLGYGLGASIGATLHYKNTNKLCINIQTDGDLLFTPSALWTIAHYKLPMLIIVMNNSSYGNTKKHSEVIAKLRNRDISKKHIGNDFCKPDINYQKLAESFGICSFTAVKTRSDVTPTINKATDYIKREKRAVLIDIRIQ